MAKVKCLSKTEIRFNLPDQSEQILELNKEYELPIDNEYVAGLIAQGYLEVIPQPETVKDEASEQTPRNGSRRSS